MAGRPAGASADAVAKVQTEARKAGHAFNQHDTHAMGGALDAAIARRRYVKSVHSEYGALRFRFDLRDDGTVDAVNLNDDSEQRNSAGQPSPGGPRAPVLVVGEATQ